jgi:outer membrane receptor protein involved in Fe transport
MKVSLVIFLLFTASGFVHASSEGRDISSYSDDIFSLSLEELVNIRISTVSKKSESTLDAPGIVTVVTAAEIKTFGATDIKDVLLRIPSLYIFDSSTFSGSGVNMRAGASQHINNHVLYLIDGRPLRESQNGGLHTDINLLLPVNSLERIEIIRGPGSVLYGSNAFNGTINFITKKAEKNTGVALNLMRGHNNYSRAGASLRGALGDKGDISLIVGSLDSDGKTSSARDEAGVTDSMDLNRDGTSLLLNSNYGGLTFSAMKTEITTPFTSGAFLWTNAAEIELNREFYDLGYTHQLNDQWAVNLNYTYNQLERSIEGPGTNSSEFKSSGYLYEIAVNGQLNENTSLLVGAVVDQLKGDLGTRGGSYSTKRNNIYGQLDYELHRNTKLSIGAQWADPESGDNHTAPRIGITQRWNNEWASKLLYSEAYRSPYGSELYFDATFLQGDENLKPETIATTEMQTTYTSADYFLALTYYHSVSEDAVGRAIVGGTNTFVNEDSEITFDGIELEGKWHINNSWRMQGSYHYQVNKDDSGQDDFMPAPRTMTKIGLSYQSPRGYQLGLWSSYFGKTSKLENLEGSNTAVNNPDSDDFTLVSLNLQANIGDLLDRSQLKNIELSIYANNILDEEVYYPELGRRLVNTYPQSHVKGVYAQVTIGF